MGTIYCAKEAGGGALLASLITGTEPSVGSLVIAGESAVRYFANSDIPTISDQLTDFELEKYFIEAGPEKVVSVAATGFSIEKRIYPISRKYHVPLHSYVDHYWNLWQRFADEKTAKKWAYQPDRTYVPDEYCRKKMISSGADPCLLQLYNNPFLSINGKVKNISFGKEFRQTKCDHELNVLFVSETFFQVDPIWNWEQPPEIDLIILLGELLKLSTKKIDGHKINVLVRAHPSESPEKWDSLCNSFEGVNFLNVSELGKEELFKLTDLAFGLNSMLLIEVSRRGIPVYSYHETCRDESNWLSEIRPEINELYSRRSIEEVILRSLNWGDK